MKKWLDASWLHEHDAQASKLFSSEYNKKLKDEESSGIEV